MLILILVAVVIAAGVALALRSGASQGRSSPALGLWCLVGGLAAALGVTMVGQATYGYVAGFDPPGWLRIVTFWMLPAGVIAAAVLGTLSLKRNAGRRSAVSGLVLALLSVGAFFIMLTSVDY